VAGASFGMRENGFTVDDLERSALRTGIHARAAPDAQRRVDNRFSFTWFSGALWGLSFSGAMYVPKRERSAAGAAECG
jgi:hypothetical protein